jgi:hypothetical protein
LCNNWVRNGKEHTLITARIMNCSLIYTQKPHHKYRSSFEEDIKMDMKERECKVVNWIYLAQDILQYLSTVNHLMNLEAL